jgi:integrase
MNRGKGLRKPHFKDNTPADPLVKRWSEWLPENRSFYQSFLRWLSESSFSSSTMTIYGVAARQAIGYLDKPYWAIDPEADLLRAWERLQTHPTSPATQACYRKGLVKLAEYLRLRRHRPPKPKVIDWAYYTAALPDWMVDDVRAYLAHAKRRWRPERQYESSLKALGTVTLPLRWMVAHFPIRTLADLTPEVWFAFLDQRLAQGLNPRTSNRDLCYLQSLLLFVSEQGREICPRTLLVKPLEEGFSLPKDAPLDVLRRLQSEIQAEAASHHRGKRRAGRMDLAWFLLMLHSGLRTCEVRQLRLEEIDWQARRIRVEQSKYLKDRLVYLSPATADALRAYLEMRGPQDALPDQVFIYAHKPLSKFYCGERLHTYGRRCGVRVTPHQLRHSCATLLLNAGAPVLSVQMLLGHKYVDTTLGYARLYDGTVAADYFAAMAVVERRIALPEDALAAPPGAGRLLALVDSLRQGALNERQIEAVRALRAGILALAERESTIQDVKVPTNAT